MKGRAPSPAEKRWHDMLASNIGCIPCFKDHGVRNAWVSIHHCDGRTKPNAHWFTLGMCAGHHQKGYGVPGMLAIHGDKRAFEARYGTELEQLAEAANDLLEMGFVVPEPVLGLVRKVAT